MTVEKKIKTALALIEMPNTTIITGIRAMGGIGLSRSNTGRTMRSTVLNQPIAMPSGTPMTAPRT